MKVTSSSEFLKKLGYDIEVFEEDEFKPLRADLRFKDIIPELSKSKRGLSEHKLYIHQLKAFNALCDGKNVILTAKTGSGKTEAWALYSLKRKVKTLAIYPTLVLSADQIKRLEDYYSCIGLGDRVIKVDSPTIAELQKKYGRSIYTVISKAMLVITNPAFLMVDLKRYASRRPSYLAGFLKDVELIIVDELDFYGSRGASLLITLLELINLISRKNPQIVILTATLGNPHEIAEYLTKINGRETIVIEGKPFKVKNRTIIVYGKNLKELWNYVKAYSNYIRDKIPEMLPYIEDYELFRNYIYEVIEVLRAHGIEVPKPYIDVIEILKTILALDEDTLTIVFTNSIRTAEKVYRELRSRIKDKYRDLIAIHHHMISKDERRIIEERARQGLLRLIISVKTLMQGIDIGNVTRIIHLGLPENVREFQQREGRKGRREEIPFTETIIIPFSSWDKKLLEYGYDVLVKWVNLPLEKVYINPRNKFTLMFKALWKLNIGLELKSEEVKLLRSLKLIQEEATLFGKRVILNDKGKRVWNYMNFYEYGPPYGIKRILKENGREVYLEDISRKDFIEKLQPGCFDYASDAIVVDISKSLRITEMKLENALESITELLEAYEEYRKIKYTWGERPDLLYDVITGKVSSRVQVFIDPPINGFGFMRVIPVKVTWRIESQTPKVVRTWKGIRVLRESKEIDIPLPPHGYYDDFTYGYLYEVDPYEDPDTIRLGLAGLKVYLRISDYRISFNEVEYDVLTLRPSKAILIWEPEVCGILELIDWNKVLEDIKNFRYDELYEVLLWAVDEDAARYMILNNIPWDRMVKYIEKVLRYITGLKEVIIKDRMIKLPKPSRRYGLAALHIETIKFNRRGGIACFCIYDGEEYDVRVVELNLDSSELANTLINMLKKPLDNGLTLLHFGSRDLYLLAQHSVMLNILLDGLKKSGKLIDVREYAIKVLGEEFASLDNFRKILGESRWRIKDLVKAQTLIMQKRMDINRLIENLKEYVKSTSRTIYYAYMILRGMDGSL